ncbi:MAG: hypothetical protein M5U08_18545 [Burkholderiales bacterium]|nr:hypothetical protein [Burkholderiales bacterium]
MSEAQAQKTFDAALIERLAQILTPYAGAYALTMVRRATRAAKDPQGLCHAVAARINDDESRRDFLRRAYGAAGLPKAPFDRRDAGRPRPVDSATERRAREALLEAFAMYARGLVVLETGRASGPRDFVQRLAEKIPSGAAREAFLKKFRTAGR